MARKIKLEKLVGRKIRLAGIPKLNQLLYRLRRGDDSVFPEVMEAFDCIRKFKWHCLKKSNAYSLTTIDQDDLFQIGMLEVYQQAKQFKFFCKYCPECYDDKAEFLDHVLNGHNIGNFSPKVSISDYVSMQAYNKIRNSLRAETRSSMCTNGAFSLDDIHNINDSGKLNENELLKCIRLKSLLDSAKEDLEIRTAIILEYAVYGYNRHEIAKMMIGENHYRNMAQGSVEQKVSKILKSCSGYYNLFLKEAA